MHRDAVLSGVARQLEIEQGRLVIARGEGLLARRPVLGPIRGGRQRERVEEQQRCQDGKSAEDHARAKEPVFAKISVM